LKTIKDNLRFFRIIERVRLCRMHNLLVLALLIFLYGGLYGGALPKLAAQNTNIEEQPDSIHGTVVNSVTHQPIGHALVASPDNNRFATMTDDQGHFEFVLPGQEPRAAQSSSSQLSQDGPRLNGGVSIGPQATVPSSNRPSQLMARKPGFLDEDTTQNVAPDQNEVTLPLTPESLVIGQIVLPDDADRIAVEIYHRQVQDGRARWMTVGTTVAKSNGEFRFAGLHAGTYKLLTHEFLDRDPLTFDPRGQLYGYPPVYFPAAPDFDSAATIELATGSTFQASLSPLRQAYYQIKVPVANAPTGAQIRVAVSAQGRRGPGFSLGYNQQDQRIEGMLPDGTYTLEVLSYGSPSLSGMVNITIKGGVVQAPALLLQPGGTIAVNVKEEFTPTDNAGLTARNNNRRSFSVPGPRRYLNIMLWPADDFGLENTAYLGPPSPSGDDSLAILNAQPGRYWVQVTSGTGFPASITSGGTDLQHHPLVVGPGGSSSPIEITMRDDWAQLQAKIEHSDESLSASRILGYGISASGSVAIINGTSAWTYLVPLADSPGVFQQFGIPLNGESGEAQVAPGEYRVLAFDHPQSDIEYRDPEAMRAYDAKGQVLRLVAGQKEHITVPLISTSVAP
jgi:hypothetical protein